MTVMSISRKKFVLLFLLSGFAFMAITTSLLGSTGPRGFPKQPDSVLRTGSDSPVAWKRVLAAGLYPIKVVLLWPLALPNSTFLQDDPPPPFVGAYIAAYWSLLALGLHAVLKVMARTRRVSVSKV